MVPIQYYFILSTAVFCIGILDPLTRRNALLFLTSVGLMLNAVNINLAAFSHYQGNVTDQAPELFTMALATAEMAVGIGTILILYRDFDSVDAVDVTTTGWQSTAGISDFTPAIVLSPLPLFLIALGAGRCMSKGDALVGIGATASSSVLPIATLFAVNGGQTYNQHVYTWATGVGDAVTLDSGLLIDPPSSMILVIVTLVVVLIHIFGLGYMNDEGETDLPCYCAGLGLFTASMLTFVVSSNLLMAFTFFELVGLCSCLFIGFRPRREGSPSTMKKAFPVTRFGNYPFLISVVAVFAMFGSAVLAGPEAFPILVKEALHGEHTINTFLDMGERAWFTVVGLLILGDVVGKSAQFPLHTWLPDVMEGPTSASALIHAATMAAADVYLVARMYGLYALAPMTLGIITLVGDFTALFVAVTSVVKKEIKQVLVYSAVSRCGYMMLELSIDDYVVSAFHLPTHAFFKTLLSLGAGTAIIAIHHNEDMWGTGNPKDKIPVTYYAFLSGSLALADIIPLASFWSKNETLYGALNYGLRADDDLRTVFLVVYAMGLIAVFFTGFYTFRTAFLTFHGEPRSDTARDPHGFGRSVKFPLAVLGVLMAVIGPINMAPVEDLTGIHLTLLHDRLDGGISLLTAHHYPEVLGNGIGAGLYPAGIGPIAPGLVSLALTLADARLTYRLYNVSEPVEHTDKFGNVETVLYNNYYQDEYQVWITTDAVQPISRILDRFNQGIVDGIINGISSVSLFTGSRVKCVQTGVISNYVALPTLGLTALLLGLGLLGGWFA